MYMQNYFYPDNIGQKESNGRQYVSSNKELDRKNEKKSSVIYDELLCMILNPELLRGECYDLSAVFNWKHLENGRYCIGPLTPHLNGVLGVSTQ